MKRKHHNKVPYSGRGKITKKFSVPRDVYGYIWSLTEFLTFPGAPAKFLKYRKKNHRFISHIYASMRQQGTTIDIQKKKKGFVPIYRPLIDKEFGRDLDVILLRDAGVIEIKPHNTFNHRSREYKLVDEIFYRALSIDHEGTINEWKILCEGKDFSGRDRVDLMTGRRITTIVKSEYLYKDKSGTRDPNTPKLFKKSMKKFKPCPFNPKYVLKWISDLKGKFERERDNFVSVKEQYEQGSPEYNSQEREFLTALGRYQNDLLSMNTILNQIPRKLKIHSTKNDTLYEYKAAYSIQRAGRLSEIHTGFQNASQVLKRLLLRDMQGMRYNYDLKSSQARILLQELEDCNMECEWLKSYLEDDDAKNNYAAKVGISVDTWKKCFYALIMGASASIRSQKNAIYETLKEYFGKDEQKIKEAQKRFIKEARELITAADQWRNYICLSKSSPYLYPYGKKYWKNACGMRFKKFGIKFSKKGNTILLNEKKEKIHDVGLINECKRQLAAFILQGQEACFIHHLTIICSKNGIPVYKNEHDGIITGKKIPKILIEKAAKESGLLDPILKRKPLCSKEKRAEMKEYVKKTM